jgi:hypothetical protein
MSNRIEETSTADSQFAIHSANCRQNEGFDARTALCSRKHNQRRVKLQEITTQPQKYLLTSRNGSSKDQQRHKDSIHRAKTQLTYGTEKVELRSATSKARLVQ